MNNIYFTSDTHFGAERTLKLSKRPFNSVSEMNETLITNWNNTVDNDDIVIHCGDFGDYNTIKKLNGKVILIYGNHEMEDSDKEGPNEFYNRLKNLGFYSLKPSGSIPLPINNELIFNFCHKPSDANKNYFNIFGHIHELCKVKRFGFNCGVDCNFFKPVDLETVLFFKDNINNYYYDDDVFMEYIEEIEFIE